MDLRLEFQEQRPETHDHDDDFPCVIHYLPNGLLLKYHHSATPAISFFFFFFYCLSTYRPYSILYEFHCLAFETNKTTQKKKKTNGKIKEEEGEKGKKEVCSRVGAFLGLSHSSCRRYLALPTLRLLVFGSFTRWSFPCLAVTFQSLAFVARRPVLYTVLKLAACCETLFASASFEA